MKHGNHFTSCFQLSPHADYLALADKVLAFEPRSVRSRLQGHVIGVFFEEPSTRTRFSTESAAYRMGVQCITSLSPAATSIAKGESFEDSARIWSMYCDLLCVRHRLPGYARLLGRHASVPVINLGDGPLEHPTQGLATILHIASCFGRTKDVRICIWGDVAMSRCAHSVLIACVLLGAAVWLCPFPKRQLPEDLLRLLGATVPSCSVGIVDNVEDIPHPLDVLYVNRLQVERRADGDQVPYAKITSVDMAKLQKNGIVLHPLPRRGELPDEICCDTRVRIWQHAEMTLRTRQFLLYQYLANVAALPITDMPFETSECCGRPDCASSLFPSSQRPASRASEAGADALKKTCGACLRQVAR